MSVDPLRDLRERWNERDSRAPSQAPPKKRRSPAPRQPTLTAPEKAPPGGALRRLATPRAIQVRTRDRGVPAFVNATPVEAILEEWVVEDRWWSGRPVRRRYFELVLAGGRNAVVFRDLVGGDWFAQRA